MIHEQYWWWPSIFSYILSRNLVPRHYLNITHELVYPHIPVNNQSIILYIGTIEEKYMGNMVVQAFEVWSRSGLNLLLYMLLL